MFRICFIPCTCTSSALSTHEPERSRWRPGPFYGISSVRAHLFVHSTHGSEKPWIWVSTTDMKLVIDHPWTKTKNFTHLGKVKIRRTAPRKKIKNKKSKTRYLIRKFQKKKSVSLNIIFVSFCIVLLSPVYIIYSVR